LSPSTKSARAALDCAAPMGRGASATVERLAASLGRLDAVAPRFEQALDVTQGGVLFALPALLVSGLLRHASRYFHLPRGYYELKTIFLLLAFMALARLESIERLRYYAPGEWGKLLGLDRIPEVRTLRAKVTHLGAQKQAFEWSAELCREWMGEQPHSAALLYVDGHVRVYHGAQTQLPKHYVARERLCLRATVDYWVNAMDGQPFFVLSEAVDPGLLQVLEQEIIPRLEREVPQQPSQETLAAERLRHRFTVVFDREGYSPGFMARMKDKRIACLTYHKHPGEDWPAEEFVLTEATLPGGESVTMRLAERGTHLAGQVWVREIRKLTDSGHQVAVISTDYTTPAAPLACAMFARWSQENFFRYMRQHFGLDRLVVYQTESIPETTKVVNPAYRTLDGQVRKQAGKVSRQSAQFGAMNLEADIEPPRVEAFERRKAELHDSIAQLQQDLVTLKAQRKATPRHITVNELPEAQRFERLSTQSKHFIDTIKMIAYRAETAMAQVLRETMSRHDDARSLLCAIYRSDADLLPDAQRKTLTVRLHPLANDSSDAAVRHLCTELNATETIFPGTDLRLIYEMVSSQNLGDQEV
jgi:hypothetical protein